MNNKFYNYLYDYIIREGHINDKNPKDQKEKMIYVKEYINNINNKYKNKEELLKEICFNRYVIRYEDIPENYYKHQEQINFNRGFGYQVLSEEERENHAKMIIKDQKVSLNKILDFFFCEYLEKYPNELKIWAFTNLLKLGKYNKETEQFARRTKGTVYPFIDINKESFFLTMDTMNKYLNDQKIENQELFQLISNNDLNTIFNKMYTYFFNNINQNKNSNQEIDGIWIKYEKDSDPLKLIKSLEGKGTGWCIVIDSVAERYLKKGEMYVYYTKGEDDKYTNPRIAIRMNRHNNIGEISGIAKGQGIEPELIDILKEKIKEFPDKDKYLKKHNDMNQMTSIYNKNLNNIDLSLEELKFLYEIDDEIKGFGYGKDPRIKEIIYSRDIKNDLSKIFNCTKEEIGVSPEPLGNTQLKYYYGDLHLYCYDGTDIILPSVIKGNLYLEYLAKIGNIVFPDKVEKNVYLNNLLYIDKLNFSCEVNGNIYLDNLKCANEIIFSKKIKGSIRVENLERINKLIIENDIEGNLHLDSLKSANSIIILGNLGKEIYLYSLNDINEFIVTEISVYNKISEYNINTSKKLVRKITK